jgi:hypothetical protein
MNPVFLREKLLFCFDVIGIRYAAFVNGTNGSTLGFIVEPDAFRAEIRIDHVNGIPFADSVIRTLRKAGSAGNAVIGNQNRHPGLLDHFFA